MKTTVDARLRDEAARFHLRFACDDCAHFDDRRGACTHGYPDGARGEALTADAVTFCKEFELGACEATRRP